MTKTQVSLDHPPAIDEFVVFLNSICTAYAALLQGQHNVFVHHLRSSSIVTEATQAATLQAPV